MSDFVPDGIADLDVIDGLDVEPFADVDPIGLDGHGALPGSVDTTIVAADFSYETHVTIEAAAAPPDDGVALPDPFASSGVGAGLSLAGWLARRARRRPPPPPPAGPPAPPPRGPCRPS